ncbi:MAG TPA: hypothetical protein VL979_10155 [Solirubrobacteraceae bacterium]|nr:hypothetical protein [Solirubrobacteraceae bacterium]
MSSSYPSVTGRAAPARHPVVLARRGSERALLVLVGVLVPLAAALAISYEMPTPGIGTVAEVAAALAGLVAVVALATSRRYTVTLTLLMLYLGLLDGPVKLLTSSRYFSGVRDVLILAVAIGMLARLPLKQQRISLPPLSGWVLGFAALVVVEALNPNTGGFLKSVGGYRQELEFVPLFFFGYAIVRSKQRLRQLFLLLGVIALANGVVGAVQYRLSPAALGRWGPGYNERVAGKHGRTYKAEGSAHSRPPALGSDAGFGGGVGTIALPGLIALLNTGALRRRWPVLLCSAGALLGVATAASRSSLVDLLVVLASFVLLSMLARLRLTRALSGLLMVVALAFGVAGVLVAVEGSGVFKRQASIEHAINGVSSEASGAEGEEAEGGGDAKVKHLNQIPSVIANEPFGLGLGVAGSVAGLGGKQEKTIEEQKVSGGSAFNLLAVELGLPGLLLWVGFSISVLALALARLRRVQDVELRTYLVAIVAAFTMLTVEGFVGPTLAVTPAGAYLWFAPGVLAYWLAGPGRSAMAGKLGAGAGGLAARLAPST